MLTSKVDLLLTLLNLLRTIGFILLAILIFFIYKEISTNNVLSYHYIPFTYDLAGFFGQAWPFKITLLYPTILCILFNLSAWFPCKLGYLFIKSILVAALGLVFQAVITRILEVFLFFNFL